MRSVTVKANYLASIILVAVLMSSLFTSMFVGAIGEIEINETSILLTDGSNPMQANLDMAGYSVFNTTVGLTNTIATTIANNEYFAHNLTGKPNIVTVTTANITYDSEPVLVGWDQVNSNSTHIRFTCVWANATAITDDAIYVTANVVYEP